MATLAGRITYQHTLSDCSPVWIAVAHPRARRRSEPASAFSDYLLMCSRGPRHQHTHHLHCTNCPSPPVVLVLIQIDQPSLRYSGPLPVPTAPRLITTSASKVFDSGLAACSGFLRGHRSGSGLFVVYRCGPGRRLWCRIDYRPVARETRIGMNR